MQATLIKLSRLKMRDGVGVGRRKKENRVGVNMLKINLYKKK